MVRVRLFSRRERTRSFAASDLAVQAGGRSAAQPFLPDLDEVISAALHRRQTRSTSAASWRCAWLRQQGTGGR